MTCSIDGCTRAHEAKGFCKLHYCRWWRTGEPGRALSPFDRGEQHNPWVHLCPPCPHCGGRDDTYLWARDDGVNRWICAPCCAFFEDEARAVA